MKKKINMVWLIIVVAIIMSTICTNYSYAVSGTTIHSIGGKLLGPVMDLFVTLSDGIIDITQKVLFGIDGDAIVEVDRVDGWIAKGLGIIAGFAILAGCVALACFFAPVTGVVATIAVGVGTAVISIGKFVKTYFVVSTIVSSMLNNTFQLPFIVISPENIIQNKVGMFNVNFFDEDIDVNIEDNSVNIANELHSIVAKWYYAIRTLVIILFMVLLIYTGIRILITSISEEKAKYKKMLVDWLISFCLLFVIHYIMIFSMYLVEEFTELVSNVTNDESVEYFEIVDDKVYDYVKENLVDDEDKPSWTSEKIAQIKGKLGLDNSSDSGEYSMLYINEEGKKTVRFPVDNFMSQARIKAQLLDRDTSTETYVSVGWKLIYVMLTLLTIKFGWIYIKRVVYIAFLIIIAPFVVLTYSIDKFRDGQAQGFNIWLKEYLFNLAIQPFHLILLTVFVGSAMALASKSPIYVLVVLGFISQAETILRNMFGFQKASTPGVLSGALGTGVAMSAIQKVFGRKPPQQHSNNYLNKLEQKGTDSTSRIELNTDDSGTGEDSQSEGEGAFAKIKKVAEVVKDVKEGLDVVEGGNATDKDNDNEKGIVPAAIKAKDLYIESTDKQGRKSEEQMNKETASKFYVDADGKRKEMISDEEYRKRIRSKKKKAKFKLGKALKGAGRHYVQSKGKALANKTMNTDFVGGAKKALLGGMATMATGTAGVILGALEGSPEKAVRNAVVAGAASYKGVSNIIDSHKIDGTSEAFIKSGYGDEYNQHKNEVLAKEIKNDLEKRNELKEEFDWDRNELNKFLEETVDEYINSGVKQFDDMIIGEKLKVEGIAKNTKEAIGIMAMGQRIGTDSTKLTDKKRKEWAETFMARNSTMSKIQKELKQKQKEYDEQIQGILKQQLEKSEEKRQIENVKIKMNADKELNGLKRSVESFEKNVLYKVDRYSEHKYK